MPLFCSWETELRYTPDQKQPVDDPKIQGESDSAMGPPLTVMAKHPTGVKGGWFVCFILKGLLLVPEPLQVIK